MAEKDCAQCGEPHTRESDFCSLKCQQANSKAAKKTCTKCKVEKTGRFNKHGVCRACFQAEQEKEKKTCTICKKLKAGQFVKGVCQSCYKIERNKEEHTCTQCLKKKTGRFVGGVCRSCYDFESRKKEQTCTQCKATKAGQFVGTICLSCWQSAKNEEEQTCIKCKQSKKGKFYASGICDSCYQSDRSKEKKTCTRCKRMKPGPFYAGGICTTCYQSERNKEEQTCTECELTKGGQFYSGVCKACYESEQNMEERTCLKCEIVKVGQFIGGICKSCYRYGQEEEEKMCIDCEKIKRGRFYADVCNACYLSGRKQREIYPPGLATRMQQMRLRLNLGHWSSTVDQLTSHVVDAFHANSSLPDSRIGQLHPGDRDKSEYVTPFTKVVCTRTEQGNLSSNIVAIPQKFDPKTQFQHSQAYVAYLTTHQDEVRDATMKLRQALLSISASDEADLRDDDDEALVYAETPGADSRSEDVAMNDGELRGEVASLKPVVYDINNPRVHQEIVRVEHLHDMQDLRTQRALRALDGEEVAPIQWRNKLFVPDKDTVDPTAYRGPLVLTILRSSAPLPPVLVGLYHLENLIVTRDWLTTRRLEEHAEPRLRQTPQPASVVSLVHEKAAWHPMPAWPNMGNSVVETQFIQSLEQAHAQGREVIILARGISGFSTFPDAFAPIVQRFTTGPNPLVVRIAFALRHNFVTHADGCLPAQPQPYPFRIPKNDPANARGFHHTAVTNVRLVHEEFHGRVVSQIAARINIFLREETQARTGAMVPWLAVFVKHVRGRNRNRIVAGG